MRRRSTSRDPTAASTASSGGSAAAELFGKLDPVAVRIEDVEQAHLAVQLEDDADVDAAVAKVVRDALDVVDVDVRDRSVGLRLPFRESDLRPAALELRPASVVIHVGLGEAELVRVEVARRDEVADVVPDERRHSASPGSSTNSLTVVRNCAPVAPSTARW